MKNNRIVAQIGAVILAACLGMTDVAPAFAAGVDDSEAPAAEELIMGLDAAKATGLENDAETADSTEITEEPADVVPETETEVQSTGTAGTPAKVTGLKVTGNSLTWDSQEMTAYGYDIVATSQAGIKYYSYSAEDASGYSVWGLDSATDHYFNNYVGNCAFTLTDDLYTNASGAAGYLTPGMTYKYQVRAVNRVSSKNAQGNTVYTYTYGPWSSQVSFTLPAYAKLTKVTVDAGRSDSDTIYLNLGQAVNWYSLYATIYTDAACTNAVSRRSVYTCNAANTKAYFSYYGLTPGQTYYAKIYNADYMYWDDADLKLAGNVTYSNVITFKPQAEVKETAPATSLSIAKTEASGYYLRASSAKAMENYSSSHYVEVYYSTDNKNWYNLDEIYGTEDQEVSYSKLADIADSPNTPVYFKARAYVRVYNEGTGYYEYTAGTDSNVLTLRSPAITRISGLSYEQTSNGYELRYTGNVKSGVETVWYEYSTDKSFKKNFATQAENKKTQTTSQSVLSYDKFIPGKTYYVRAFVKSNYYSDNDTVYGSQHSAYTNVLTIKASVPDVWLSTSVTAKSVKLTMSRISDAQGPVTGYQIARKSGKSYKELKKTTDNVYTDSGLTSDTKYTYRVRAYYYNPSTKKTYYGAWAYANAMTWGSALDLKASAASTTSVKLSWKKVSGANGYEIYRYVGNGDSKYDNGEGSFSKKQLIKTIKKSTTKTYTDKGLTAGESYGYVVRAYRIKNGKTYYIDEYAEASLALDGVVLDKVTQSVKNGKTTVTWKKVPAAKGYLIERYDTDTNTWKSVKKITKNSTVKYVLPAVTGDKTSVRYRIRAYSGKKYSSAATVYTYRHIATVGTVKAKASAKNGSVTVTWKKVSGANYYKVYRTTSSASVLDSETGAIGTAIGATALRSYTVDADAYNGYLGRDYVTGTSFVDKKVSYKNQYGEEVILTDGPQKGVKYYYYVKAFKIVDEDYNAAEAAKNDISLTNFDAVSSYGYSKAASATVTSAKVGAATIKSVKSGKKNQATITLKKKVSGAVSYEIYRSSKKNSGYKKIGTTTKISYTDKTAKSKKTYYYKVKVVSRNEAGLTIYSALSKPSKAVKVK